MAGTAMNLKYYDTSVDILKAAYDIAPFKPKESNETIALLDALKKKVLKIHNFLVTKRKKRVSETHKGKNQLITQINFEPFHQFYYMNGLWIFIIIEKVFSILYIPSF